MTKLVYHDDLVQKTVFLSFLEQTFKSELGSKIKNLKVVPNLLDRQDIYSELLADKLNCYYNISILVDREQNACLCHLQ